MWDMVARKEEHDGLFGRGVEGRETGEGDRGGGRKKFLVLELGFQLQELLLDGRFEAREGGRGGREKS